MRDDEGRAPLGPRRMLLVVRLHRRDPRPRPGDELWPFDAQGETVESTHRPAKVNSPGTRPITTRDSS